MKKYIGYLMVVLLFSQPGLNLIGQQIQDNQGGHDLLEYIDENYGDYEGIRLKICQSYTDLGHFDEAFEKLNHLKDYDQESLLRYIVLHTLADRSVVDKVREFENILTDEWSRLDFHLALLKKFLALGQVNESQDLYQELVKEFAVLDFKEEKAYRLFDLYRILDRNIFEQERMHVLNETIRISDEVEDNEFRGGIFFSFLSDPNNSDEENALLIEKIENIPFHDNYEPIISLLMAMRKYDVARRLLLQAVETKGIEYLIELAPQFPNYLITLIPELFDSKGKMKWADIKKTDADPKKKIKFFVCAGAVKTAEEFALEKDRKAGGHEYSDDFYFLFGNELLKADNLIMKANVLDSALKIQNRRLKLELLYSAALIFLKHNLHEGFCQVMVQIESITKGGNEYIYPIGDLSPIWLKAGNPEKALKLAMGINNVYRKYSVLYEIGKYYLDQWDCASAENVLKKMTIDYVFKAKLISKLALWNCQTGNKEKGFMLFRNAIDIQKDDSQKFPGNYIDLASIIDDYVQALRRKEL